jgi:MFS family permease
LPRPGLQRYLAPWYLAYLILGIIHSGMLPFLLPLTVPGGVGHDLGGIAYVVGAYNVGLLPASLLGLVAERRHLLRPVFFGGFVAIAVGLGGLPEVSRLGSWAVLAAPAGLGAGAVATVAPQFVVDFAPKPEWEPRIGWPLSGNGAGQLAGRKPLVAALTARKGSPGGGMSRAGSVRRSRARDRLISTRRLRARPG